MPKLIHVDNDKKVIVYSRNKCVYAFNFNPTESFDGYYLTLPLGGEYKVIFNTDENQYGGFNRISSEYVYSSVKDDKGQEKIQIYLPSRTALVLKKV